MHFPTAFLFRPSPHLSLLRCMSTVCSLASRIATVKGCAELAWYIIALLNTPFSPFQLSWIQTIQRYSASLNSALLTHQPSFSTRINTYHLPFPRGIRQHITFIKKMSLRTAMSLPRRATCFHASAVDPRRWPSSKARAFSTTMHRDATWGFVGLGQMGM